MLLMILTMKRLLEHFTKNNFTEANREKFKIRETIKRKGKKLYVKWKGYDNSLNIWIDKTDVIESNSIK